MIKARNRDISRSEKLSSFLHQLRVNSNLTLMDVQEKSKRYQEKVNFDYLSRVERGALFPSLPKLLTLARVYKISPSIFFDLIEIEEYEKVKPDISNYEECKTYGISCANHGDLDKAIGAFSKCFDIVSKNKNLKNKKSYFSDIRLCAAIAFRQKGKLSLAREELEKALLNRDLSPFLKMRVLTEFANIYVHQDNTALAKIFINHALEVANKEKDLSIMASAYVTLANALIRELDFKEAAIHYTKAIRIFEKKKDIPNLITASNNLGSCLIKMGLPEKSISILKKAALLSEKEGLKRIYTNVMVNLGDAYRLQEKYDKAKLCLMEASRISKEYDYAKNAFLSNLYLWKISLIEKDLYAEREYFSSCKFYRTKIQETFDDIKEFDALLKTTKSKKSLHENKLHPFKL